MLRLGNAPIALHIPQQELSAANASSSHALAAVFQKKTFAENYTNPTQVALSSPASACAMNQSQLAVHLNHQHTRALACSSGLLLFHMPVAREYDVERAGDGDDRTGRGERQIIVILLFELTFFRTEIFAKLRK